MKKHVALAFSGGLDTSFCVLYLREQGYDVTTVTVDTGGFSQLELQRIEELSPKLGAKAHRTVDARAELFDRYLRYLIYGNVLRGNLYPLSVSAERVAQAAQVVAVAKEVKATALGHGSTGAGNDQVRFDVAFRALAPELELVTPIRSLGLSRVQESQFLHQHGIEFPEKTRDYSVNAGMWGTSVGGRETLDAWSTLPAAAFPGGAIDTATLTEKSSPSNSRQASRSPSIPGTLIPSSSSRPSTPSERNTASAAACIWVTPSSASRVGWGSRRRRRIC